MTRIVILGAGFAGLQAAKNLGSRPGFEVTLLDRRNFHLFQPLLYQVAMAGLSPADIAAPIRSLLSRHENVRVVRAEAKKIDRDKQVVHSTAGEFPYDSLIVATGMQTSYFGKDEWADHAAGLKTIEDATEIRRKVLLAFEQAEIETDPKRVASLLTFVVVGGGPTGVELAGAIREMASHALARDFRRIDARESRVVLVEAGDRVLPTFDRSSSERAERDLANLGVEVRLGESVSSIDETGVRIGDDTEVECATVLWAAGVRATPLADALGAETDRQGRVRVLPDLSLPHDRRVFIAGDLARVEQDGAPLPGQAPVAMQQGRYLARLLRRERDGLRRKPFRYFDKGQMATIGRSKAVLESGGIRMGGFPAWLGWVVVHIYYLSSFRNRLFVLLQWAWSYFRFGKGARLITGEDPASEVEPKSTSAAPNDADALAGPMEPGVRNVVVQQASIH